MTEEELQIQRQNVERITAALLGDLEGRPGLIDQNTQLIQKMDYVIEKLRKHDDDIDNLKQWRTYVIGIASGISGLVAWFSDVFKGHS